MYPSAAQPAFGSFVRDQVEALRRIDGVEVQVYAFAPGSIAAYAGAARDLRRRHRSGEFDVVHAHFGLSAWPALAVGAPVHAVTLHGTDLAHPRSRVITLASLRRLDLVAAVSKPLAATIPRWALRGQPAVLPCGVELRRFHPIPRREARAALGLDPDRPCLLFPADPRRREKRHDLAQELAGEVPLLTLGGVDPDRVPLLVNAANAVIVPSDREGFGLAALEALACDVPVLATDVGIAPEALAGLDGAYCGPFELSAWRAALAAPLAAADPRISGRARAEQFSTDRLAANVVSAWRRQLGDRGPATAASAGDRGVYAAPPP